MLKKILYSIFATITILPVSLYAKGLVTCEGTNCNYTHFKTLFKDFFTTAIKFGIAAIAIAFVYAGFLYLTSGSNSGQRTKANTVLKNSLIGIVVIILAYTLVDLLLTTLGFNEEFKIKISD